MHFNTAIHDLPGILYARPLGFSAREFFSAGDDAQAVPSEADWLPRAVSRAGGDATLALAGTDR